MALYINGRPVNPIVTFLVSAVVIAGIIGLGILLLPVIGGLFVIALLIVAGIALYGAYCRWRYGDPFAQMQKQAEEMLRRRARSQEEQPQQQTVQDEPDLKPDLKTGTARTGIKRVTVVEDAVVVEEIRHKDL